MSIEQSNLTFEKARKSGDSLSKIEREIRQAEIKNKAKEDLSSLRNSISDELITKLYGDGMKVVSGDALHHINHITLKRLHIKWYDGKLDKRDDANDIWPGDTIKIEGNKAFRYHNGKKTEIGEVEKKKEDLVVAKAPEKKQGTPTIKPKDPKNPSNGKKEQTPPTPTDSGSVEEQTPPAAEGEVAVNPTTTSDQVETSIIGNTIITTQRTKDGRIYLIGPDGKEKIFLNEQLDKKLNIQTTLTLEVIDIWSQEARRVIENKKFKWISDDDEVIEGILGKIDLLKRGIIQKGNITNEEIKKLFTLFDDAESQEEIIDESFWIGIGKEGFHAGGSNNLSTIKEILLNNNMNEEERRSIIYDNLRVYSKAGGTLGNSSGVKDKLGNHLVESNENFTDIKELLKDPETYNLIKSGNYKELSKYLNNDIDQAKEIIEAYRKLEAANQDNREMFENHAKNTLKHLGITDITKIKILTDSMIKASTKGGTLKLLQDVLLFNKIEKNPKLENDENIGIYGNISGVGDFTLSDEHLRSAIDYGSIIAISAVTMGLGIWGAAWTTTKLGITGLAANSIIGGTIFYEVTNTLNNLIYQKEFSNLFVNGGDFKEIGKSIAFFGILGGVSKYLLKIPGLKGLKIKPGNKIPMQILKGSTQIAIDAGILTVVSQSIEWGTGEGFNPTWEEYIQAIIMVGLFKGAGIIKFSRGKKGELIAKQEKVNTDTKTPKVETIPKSKIELPKNETFIIKDGKQVYKITTGEKGEIVEVNKGKGPISVKYFDEILNGLYKKGIEFGTNGEGLMIRANKPTVDHSKSLYRKEGKVYDKEGNIYEGKFVPATIKPTISGESQGSTKTKIPDTKRESKETYTKTEQIKGEIESRISKIKEIIKNSPLSFINREFRSFFNKHDFEKSSLLLGKSKTITKEGNYFKVNNGDINYTQKQLFKEIITTKHKRNKLISIAEKNIKNAEISISLDKPWYPFGRAQIKIENGKIKKFNLKEKKYEDMDPTKIEKFLKENPKIMEEIIKKQIDKVRLETLNWEGIGTGSKELLWKTLKNSIFSKGHLKIIGFSSAFTIYDILVNEEKNKDKLLNEALLSFALSYIPMATLGILVIGKRAFQYGGGKIIDLGVKPIWNSKVVQHVVSNWGKYTIGGLTTVAGIKIYTAEDKSLK